MFAIYLTIVWPVLWVLIGQRLAPKSLTWSVGITVASLGGFTLGAIILTQIIPETIRLNLTPTQLYTQYGVIYGAGVTLTPTFWHHLLLFVPFMVIIFAAIRIFVGFLALMHKTRAFKPTLHKLQKRINMLSHKNFQTPPRLLVGDSGVRAFSSLSKVYITNGIVTALDDEKLDAVLAHELSHVKTKDIILLWLWSIASSLAFVLPRKASWSIFMTELEKKADKNAATIIGSPFPVAEAIVSVARLSLSERCATNFASGDLEKRIEALVSGESKAKSNKPAALLVAIALMSTLIFIPAVWPTQNHNPISGMSETQYHTLLEGKAIALVKKSNNPQKPVSVKILPKEALKKAPNGEIFLDMTVTFGKL
jgi:Zn-dependent protease with chaperone function